MNMFNVVEAAVMPVVSQVSNTNLVESLDVISKIDDLYSHAFDRFTAWVAGIFVVLGILGPVVSYLLQVRLIKMEEKNMLDQVDKRVNEKIRELEDSICRKFDEANCVARDAVRSAKVETEKMVADRFEESENAISRLTGGLFFVQMSFFAKQENWRVATLSGLRSAYETTKGKDTRPRIQKATFRVSNCLSKCNREDVEWVEESSNGLTVDKLIQVLEENDTEGDFDEVCKQLKKE